MLFIRGGKLYDGSGTAPRIGNLLIRDGRIAAIGDVTPPPGAEVLDATGLVVAPGFIDLHSHSDIKTLEGDRAKAGQGVTAELVGNCGFSAFPHAGHAEEVGQYNEGILCSPRCYSTARAFFAQANSGQSTAHLASLVGHGTLRTAVAALYPDASPAQQIDAQASLLDEALAEGAAGFSSGLMYAPGATAPAEELEALCSVTARRGKLYATHMRSYSWQLIESVDEQLTLARTTGVRLQISHLQAVGKANWHKQPLAIEKIEKAHAEGVDVAFDAYPYGAGCTVLSQLLPQEALARGYAHFERELGNPEYRRQIELTLREQTAQGWDDIHIAFHGPLSSGRNVAGKTIARIAAEWAREPESTVLDLLLESGNRVNILAFNQAEDNLRALLCHPLASVITDGIHLEERPHPRLFGTFPHLLGELCRDRGWMPLETAIHKITALPASRLGWNNRGRLAVNCVADVVIFDPHTVGAQSTYEQPKLPNIGIRGVLREGKLLSPAVQHSG